MRGILYSLLFAFVVVLFAATENVATADPADGEVLTTITRPEGCFGTNQGVGVTYFHFPFYGNVILYTCQDPATDDQSTSLFWTDMEGTSPFINPVSDAYGFERPLEAIAWDTGELILWGVNRIATGPGPLDAVCAVWRFGILSGREANFAFWYDDPDGGCEFSATGGNFVDGLAVDTNTDTLYVSHGQSTHIRHFQKDGTPAANDEIDFAALTAGICGGGSCTSSGLLFGADGTLLVATGTSGKLIQIDPTVPAIVNVFDSGAGRDWGLACGPMYVKADGSLANTILSADLLSDKINVLNSPDGVCDAIDFSLRDVHLEPAQPYSTHVGGVIEAAIVGQAAGLGPVLPDLDDFRVSFGPGTKTGATAEYRLISEPGDRCVRQTGQWEFSPVACAEGDQPWEQPSLGGQNCYDGLDNDGDGLVDADDSDCQGHVNSLSFPTVATNQFEEFSRTLRIRCLEVGSVSWTVGVGLSVAFLYDSTADDNSASVEFSVVCTEPVLLGDADSDGDVDIRDAIDVILFLVGRPGEIDETASDVDCSGQVGFEDFFLLLQHVVHRLPGPMTCASVAGT